MNVRLIAYMQLAPEIREEVLESHPVRVREIEAMITACMHGCRTNDDFVTVLKESDISEVDNRLRWAWNAQPVPHNTVFGFTDWIFEIRNVSRTLTHQLVRHRTAWFLQQSQRAVDQRDKDIGLPDTIIDKGWMLSYGDSIHTAKEIYALMVDDGVPKEDARFILPSGIDTNIYMKIDGCNLIHFMNLREHPSAQWEIKELSDKMYELVKERAPSMFSEEYKRYWY